YTFDAPKGRRKHYFFNMVERCGAKVRFRLNDKDGAETEEVGIILDGDTESASFTLRDIEISLRADRYIPKGYPVKAEGRIEKTEDQLRDAHLHTSHNRGEIERSMMCYCISCQTFFKPEEVANYADSGETAICPYCDCDAIIADGSGVKMTDRLLAVLHKRYFDFSTNPLIELTIDEADEVKPTPCSPYVWIVRIQNQDGCAVDVDFYTREEAREKLRDFLADIPTTIFRTTFEAIDCKLHDIEGKEAIDAISVAIAKYFESDDESTKVDLTDFTIERDVDFALTTAWNGETEYFTLLTDGTLEYITA
ncbi:MAG: hypothetical protein K2K94_05660, partial [Muribaculaceae bacterium]|nr:hypothetical protein [Muribaculaceae bacterium]